MMYTRDDLKAKRAEFEALFAEATAFRDTHQAILVQESRYKDQLDRMRSDLYQMQTYIDGAETQGRAETVKALIKSKKPRQTYAAWWPQAEKEYKTDRRGIDQYLKRWLFVTKTGLEVKLKNRDGLRPTVSWRRAEPAMSVEYAISQRYVDIPVCNLFVFPVEVLEE